jgi:hypothetical protein
MTDSTTQAAKKLPWEFLRSFLEFFLFFYSPNSEFSHVLGCLLIWNGMSSYRVARAAAFFSDKGGCSFSRGEKRSLDAEKYSAVIASLKQNSDWDRTDDQWVNFRPMVTFHGGAGRPSCGIGHIWFRLFCEGVDKFAARELFLEFAKRSSRSPPK